MEQKNKQTQENTGARKPHQNKRRNFNKQNGAHKNDRTAENQQAQNKKEYKNKPQTDKPADNRRYQDKKNNNQSFSRGGKQRGGRGARFDAGIPEDIKLCHNEYVANYEVDEELLDERGGELHPEAQGDSGAVVGRNAVRELLKSDRSIDKIFVRRGDRE